MSRVLAKDATSKTIYVFIRGSATTPVGMGLTGLAFGTAGLKVYYTRAGAAAAAITLATQTVTGAWATGGFVEVDATNAPGLYRLDLPNAALATGVDEVVISWTGANTVDDGVTIALAGYDPLAAGVTAAAVRTEIDSNSTQLAAIVADTNDIQTRLPAALVSGRIDASVGAIAAAAITDAAFATEAELAALPSTGAQTLPKMVRYLYQRFRHKRTVTATTDTLFKADGVTALGTAALTDDATTFTRGADA